MGFSTIGAGIVLFIGMLFVASTVLSATFEGQSDVMQATRDDRDRDRFARETDARITDDTSHSDQWFTVHIENTGGTTLTPSKTGLFLDGDWIASGEIEREVDGDTGTDVWAPGQTLELRVEVGGSENAPDRAYVVLETGRGLVWTD